MKKQITIKPLLPIFLVLLLQGPGSFAMNHPVVADTMPTICTVLPGEEIAALRLFGSPLSSSFPDPNSYETYNGCHYQFFTEKTKAQIAVRLMKWGSKQEASAEFKQQVQSHFDHWGIAPERLRVEADSIYFGIETEDSTKCDECGLVAAQGPYTIYISFKGEYETVPRERKKMVALQILRMMYDRIPGLAPSRIRNRQ